MKDRMRPLDDFPIEKGSSRERSGSNTHYTAYVASPLTVADEDELEQLFEVVRKVCQEKNIEPYFPNEVTGPDSQPEIHENEVYKIDRTKVNQSDLMVLLASSPSFGAGQEIEIARNALIPITIAYKGGSRISRMVKGVPVEYKDLLEYADLADFENKLSATFDYYNLRIDSIRDLRRSIKSTVIGKQIRKARERKEMSMGTLAEKVGLTADEINLLESGSTFEINPSFMLLMTLSEALDCDVADIISPSYSESLKDSLSDKLISVIENILPNIQEVVKARSKEGKVSDKDVKKILSRIVIDQLESEE